LADRRRDADSEGQSAAAKCEPQNALSLGGQKVALAAQAALFPI
jgi:hypothetical protein